VTGRLNLKPLYQRLDRREKNVGSRIQEKSEQRECSSLSFNFPFWKSLQPLGTATDHTQLRLATSLLPLAPRYVLEEREDSPLRVGDNRHPANVLDGRRRQINSGAELLGFVRALVAI
jgi:hypothetical protein